MYMGSLFAEVNVARTGCSLSGRVDLGCGSLGTFLVFVSSLVVRWSVGDHSRLQTFSDLFYIPDKDHYFCKFLYLICQGGRSAEGKLRDKNVLPPIFLKKPCYNLQASASPPELP